jgi:hypothetical protein
MSHNNKHLTPTFIGQLKLANYSQEDWLFQSFVMQNPEKSSFSGFFQLSHYENPHNGLL